MDLLIFYHILDDPAVQALLQEDSFRAKREIIRFGETRCVSTQAGKEYIISLLANDENILSLLLQAGKTVGADLRSAALEDVEQIFSTLLSRPVEYTASGNGTGYFSGYCASICSLIESRTPQELLERLEQHYRTLGGGVLSQYVAFKYDGTLQGVTADASVTFDYLVGLDYQKQVLIDNTQDFLKNHPANNVLLFGDRGTGKSSCVKALLNHFYSQGLRVVEFPKHYIKDIPAVSKALSASPHKYILFLDDLSFESHDSEYRALKIAMEGQLQENPDNVLIYATSNRRHLIKEKWEDRDGEIHRNDSMQETLSLSERFGISLVFAAPNQKEFLNIVKELLKHHNIEINGEIERQAIIWQMNYGSRNPRSAKQFVSSYVAKQRG